MAVFRTEVDHVVVEVIENAHGYQVTKTVSGKFDQSTTIMERERAIDTAVNWVRCFIEDQRAAERLLDEENTANYFEWVRCCIEEQRATEHLLNEENFAN